MVFVKSLNHQTLFLHLDPSTTTLRDLKLAIHRLSGTPLSLQRLHFLGGGGYSGDDSTLLSDLDVGSTSTLTLSLPFLGGTQPPKPRLEFLNSKPPANYVAGLGRGATGFTTRSDIGPARAAPDLPDRSAAPIGAAAPPRKPDEDDADDDAEEKGYDENQKFDEFEGNDVGLFASAEYDEDDKEADAVWEEVDKRMDSRRKDRREARLKEEIEKYRASNPKITEQFADLKRKLHTMSASDWDSIPEIGDYSLRNKKKKFESFVPPPDTLLEKARKEKEHVSALDPRSRDATGGQTPVTDLTAVGEGRGTVLSLKLDNLSDSISGLTNVDPKGYLTDLRSMKVTSDAEVSDIKKARLLLKSVIQTNPKHPPGWIAAARLEKNAGMMKAARQLIQKGCEACPKSDEVWLEASLMASPEDVRAVMARAVKAVPNSVKLWLHAAELEHDRGIRRKVLMKGLEQNNDAVRLWKALIDLTDEKEAMVLLHKAVESCPTEVSFWTSLAGLETYENGKKVLNSARAQLPKEPAIWIAAAKLEELKGNDPALVDKVIERAVHRLQKGGLEIDREFWMKEAENAEKIPAVATCHAIIRRTIGIGVENQDRKRTWVADAEECKKRGSIETARAIFAHALTVFLTKKSVWLKAAKLEKAHGTRESLDALLRKAVTYCPQAVTLWLMGAKEKWLAGDVPAARAILKEAYASIPLSEEIWLAAFKLEFENNEPERARLILTKARGSGTERVWMKSAIVERELGNTEEERRVLDEALTKFPSFFKLWLMLGQLEERLSRLDKAKKVYESGLKHCPNSIPIWISLANLEEKTSGLSKARAILTLSRKKNPQSPELWLAAVRAELKHGNKKEADVLMAKALQECPNSGILLAMYIEMAPRPQRKSRSRDAWTKNEQDPHVLGAVAMLFWNDRKFDKARNYLEKAVTYAPDVGDTWALYYKLELQHGTEDSQRNVLQRCVAAEPKHGEKWQAVAKAVENSHQPVEAILKKVVVAMGKD